MGFLIILVGIGLIIFAILKGRKNPKLGALIFFGLGLISLIISFNYKDWIRRDNANYEDQAETMRIVEPIVLISTCLFLIVGGYFLYKSTAKKS